MDPFKELPKTDKITYASWTSLAPKSYDKNAVSPYTKTRVILMNGTEFESNWFLHQFHRHCLNNDVRRVLAYVRRQEQQQQKRIAALKPIDETILETTIGYEQLAVDLTAEMAKKEPNPFVKAQLDFALLEDFDHLYRYSQWAYMIDGINPDNILQGKTDVVIGRPTQYHHNDNGIRIRKSYNRKTASPQTKVNIYTLLSGEQQTHNFYAEHGMMYANDDLRRTYGEICDVEEEHVTMYESLIDPCETPYEKLLLHEFTEVCTYYNCYVDESNEKLRPIWEEFLAFELGHLQIAAELLKKYEKRDPEEIIGNKVLLPCHFENQKKYVADILENEVDKRLGAEMNYTTIDKLSDNWTSYKAQKNMNGKCVPTEKTIHLINATIKTDIVTAEPKLRAKEPSILKRALDENSMSPDTVSVEEYEKMVKNPQPEF